MTAAQKTLTQQVPWRCVRMKSGWVGGHWKWILQLGAGRGGSTAFTVTVLHDLLAYYSLE